MTPPMDRSLYPDDWLEISQRVRFQRAKGRCECIGECGMGHDQRCAAEHKKNHPVTGSRVILTTAHLDQRPGDRDESRMRAYCQRCHLAYDAAWRKREAGA